MNLRPLILLALAFLTGCATTPRRYAAPDFTALDSARVKADRAVASAIVSAQKSKASVDQARGGVSATSVKAKAADVKLVELAKIAPAALQPKIASIQADVAEIQSHQQTVDAALASASINQAELTTQLDGAKEAQADLAEKQDQVKDQAVKLAEQATADNARAVKAEKALSWYRWHWWGSWIAFGAGLLICGFFAFLKFTGRLAPIATSIIQKL